MGFPDIALQPDLFGEDFPAQRILGKKKAQDIGKGIKLTAGYQHSHVLFIGIENTDEPGSYIAKVQIQKQVDGKTQGQNLQIHFRIDEYGFPVVKITQDDKPLVTFGKNTTRLETAKYSWNTTELQAILQEITQLDTKKLSLSVRKIVEEVRKKVELIYICPDCRSMFNGGNCSTCGYNNDNNINFAQIGDITSEDAEMYRLADLYAKDTKDHRNTIRIVRGLKFLPNQSDIESGKYIFDGVSMMIKGQKAVRKIRVHRGISGNTIIYINPKNWTRIFMEPKQKYGQICAAVNEIITDMKIAVE